MAKTDSDLATYVRANAGDAGYVADCWAEARALVTARVGVALVPAEVLDRAYLEVGSELFHRRSAPNGVAQFSTGDGNPVRIARDPMVGAYPILAPYIGLAIG